MARPLTGRGSYGLVAVMLIAALLAAAAPQPGEIRNFGDWAVGCDNVHACQAVALLPAGGWEDSLSFTLQRDAGPEAELIVLIAGEEGRGGHLAADGQRLAVRLLAAGGGLIAHPHDTAPLIDTFRTARSLQLVGETGLPVGTVSLDGVSAALLYMDERQGRLGTATALVRPGPQPASAVPAAEPLPEIRVAAEPEDGGQYSFGEDRSAALRRQAGCEIGEVGGPDEREVIAIETGKTLILLACGSGAYNVSHIPFIAAAGSERIVPAEFDAGADADARRQATLVNAQWDSNRRLLTQFSHGRGLGDCGTKSAWAWDGARFRLVREERMEECRGARTFIPTWRARVVRPD